MRYQWKLNTSSENEKFVKGIPLLALEIVSTLIEVNPAIEDLKSFAKISLIGLTQPIMLLLGE